MHRFQFSLHTKLVFTVTGLLILIGTLGILLIEWNNTKTLGSQPWLVKIMSSYFQSVTPRTTGYNTISLTDLRPATQFLMVLLMIIGASPSSTGGGMKTTTFATVLLAVWSMIRGNKDITVFRRRIPHDLVYKALTVTVATATLIIVVTIALTIVEGCDLLTALFETSSAYGTVGLTLGLTPKLSALGKVFIIITMFLGRVGPLTVALALAQQLKTPKFRYAEGRPLIG